MAKQPKSTLWIILHSVAIIAVLCSLLTGLRISTLTKPSIGNIEELLPQGQIHDIHFFVAIVTSAILLCYLFYKVTIKLKNTNSYSEPNKTSISYHRVVTRIGSFFLILMILSGWILFIGSGNASIFRQAHFYSAFAILLYIFLHAGVYLTTYGLKTLSYLLPNTRSGYRTSIFTYLSTGCITLLLWIIVTNNSYHDLTVEKISPETFINIDGIPQESAWSSAISLKIHTDGGANFIDGSSTVNLRALHNQQEIFFHITWEDPTESLKHLPLKKVGSDWEIQQQGFQSFNETRHYEDKFAILLSSSCDFGASGTSHLGRKPSAQLPANWHGKGYHYSSSDEIHDLWHWKAVRTNKMHLADDNYIGRPDIVRPGARRYTAGYLQDGKESGAYLMNWEWFSSKNVTPKRLPKTPSSLTPYQNEDTKGDWTISWFDYQPYTAEDDNYPINTIMPSVLYTSNRFEGDRADVRAYAVWQDGQWSMEMVRNLNTGSALDVAIKDGICLWVSAFDHSQIAHTRHALPVKIKLADQ
ncbi:ethylbenzene dehydrogenase-related protein [Microbulbifer sp. JMSA003]|uniref:ethylbenzene dehydrogenase-related protein n=1 Tax=Microbulbifer sp. JMSA003 TaxID=3243369 RepID=UPI00403A27CA